MIYPKTPQQIKEMREGGKKLGAILQKLLSQAKPGMRLSEIEKNAQTLIRDAGGTPSFSTVENYKWATCLCINEQVVHGIPTEYALKEGDLLTIDIGMIYKKLHTDTAWTIIMNNSQPASPARLVSQRAGGLRIKNEDMKEKERFLEVGKETLKLAIAQARPGNRVGHISQAIETSIKGAGYAVVRSLTGHGVGEELHEEPMIPEYLDRPVEETPLLSRGMTLAIEVIYAMGKGSIVYDNQDGWTLASKDRSLTAVFEHTIAIEDDQTYVLTEA